MPIKLMAKFCSVAAMVLLVIFALGPAWQPRTGLGWQIDHFLGYFAITSTFCLAWTRLFVVGGTLMAVSALLEGLQAITLNKQLYGVALNVNQSFALKPPVPWRTVHCRARLASLI